MTSPGKAAPDRTETAEAHRTPDAAVPHTGNYWDYCPNCGHRLQNRGCKYRCPRCHYFMSCSDFD